MRARRTAVIAAVASAVVLTAVPLGNAVAKNSGSATPSAATPPPKSLGVDGGDDLSGVVPGGPAVDLAVYVSNPKKNTGNVRVESVTARIDSPVPGGCSVGVIDPGGSTAGYDVAITNYKPAAGTGVQLDRNDVGKQVALTIQAFNRPYDQQACKGLELALSYTATAAGK